MRNYIAKLYKHLEDEDEKRKAARHQTATTRLIIKLLETQLIELFLSLPEAELRRPWLMQELVSHLDGRYQTDSSPQKIVEALRRVTEAEAR